MLCILYRCIFLVLIIQNIETTDIEHSGDNPDEQHLLPADLIISRTSFNNEHPQFINLENKIIVNSLLKNDMNDFFGLIPSKEIKEKILEYYRNDNDVQQIYDYMNSKEFKTLRKNILELREVKDFINYLDIIGLNIKEMYNKIDNLLEFSKSKPSTNHKLQIHSTIGGLYELTEDILTLLPQDEIFILFFDKLEKNSNFKHFIKNIGSQEFTRKYESLKKSQELQIMLTTLKKHKIDVGKITEMLQNYFLLM